MFYPAGQVESKAFAEDSFPDLEKSLNEFFPTLGEKVLVEIKMGFDANAPKPAQALLIFCESLMIDAGAALEEGDGEFPGGFKAPSTPSEPIPPLDPDEEEQE